ncbi:MAG: Nif3-like dinuclear metal center hexameric protein [Muribaculaceae bacterium]|nr:Nif3-like dinuclear metal center hexameric protein [Muribaculaceae bacterium]
MPDISQIISAIEDFAPLRLQEEWDNSGLQVGSAEAPCTGIMLCVDPTEEVIREAAATGCNLVIAHHPLLFRGLKTITGANPVQRAVIAAIQLGITVYSAHTSMDNAHAGVSARMSRMLGLADVKVLEPRPTDPATGSGAIGTLPEPLPVSAFIQRIKDTFDTPVVRCSVSRPQSVSRVALCGGAGAFLIPRAVTLGADAFICSDTRYHEFADFGSDILIADIGHYESEHCITSIFYDIIREKFPNFAVRQSVAATNPITYM